jgi:hypothetical protein
MISLWRTWLLCWSGHSEGSRMWMSRCTSLRAYEIYVRNPPQVCEGCIADLLDELVLSDSLACGEAARIGFLDRTHPDR